MIEVEQAGALTTVQDLGRRGWRHLGVAVAGALDPDAAALANRLVGNAVDAALLEFSLTGPALVLRDGATIALTGGDVEAMHIDAAGARTPVPCGRPVALPAGKLRVGAVRRGVRGWLAMAGGIDVAPVLGSRSTDLRGGFGGLHGRALKRGDVLRTGVAPPALSMPTPAWWFAFDELPQHRLALHFVPCADDRTPVEAFADQAWRVDSRSNRQGLRLAGEPLTAPTGDIVSLPVAPGTIQLPPDGQPIVLLADAQTTGGYPRLGYVAAADLPLLAQASPGMEIRWIAIDADASRALWARRRTLWQRMECVLDERLPQRRPLQPSG